MHSKRVQQCSLWLSTDHAHWHPSSIHTCPTTGCTVFIFICTTSLILSSTSSTPSDLTPAHPLILLQHTLWSYSSTPSDLTPAHPLILLQHTLWSYSSTPSDLTPAHPLILLQHTLSLPQTPSHALTSHHSPRLLIVSASPSLSLSLLTPHSHYLSSLSLLTLTPHSHYSPTSAETCVGQVVMGSAPSHLWAEQTWPQQCGRTWEEAGCGLRALTTEALHKTDSTLHHMGMNNTCQDVHIQPVGLGAQAPNNTHPFSSLLIKICWLCTCSAYTCHMVPQLCMYQVALTLYIVKSWITRSVHTADSKSYMPLQCIPNLN